MMRCALARRLSIQMCFPYAQMRSRSTRVGPNAFPICSGALSLDACRPKCVSCALNFAFARRLPIQMRFKSPSGQILDQSISEPSKGLSKPLRKTFPDALQMTSFRQILDQSISEPSESRPNHGGKHSQMLSK